MRASATRRRLRTLLASVLAIVMGVSAAALVAPATEAEAATVVPMTNLYDDEVNGNYIMVGNGVLVAGTPAVTGVTATDLHNAVAQNQLVNDSFTMVRRNAVSSLVAAGADNSTSATLQVPQGASIVQAYLFWQGSTGYSGATGGGIVQRCTSANGANAALPAGGPAARQPMLQVGTGAVQSIGGAVTIEPTPTTALAQYYSGYADVTQQLASIPTGSTQTINVGNIWAPEGRNCYAGWSLAVVYDFGQYIPGNDASQSRNVILTGGHVRLQQNETQTTTFSGFRSQAGDIQASFFLGEGDRNIVGDYAEYRPGTSGTYTRIPGATGDTSNVGTGVAAGSVRYQGTTTGTFSNANVDVRTTALQGIPVGTTSIQLRLGTVQDTYMLQASALAVPVTSVRIEKTFTGSGSTAVDVQHLLPGQQPTYTITVTNTGSAPLSGVTVQDQLAASCARTIGSIAVAGSVQYTCTGPATNAGLTNTATVAATGGGSDLTDSDTTLVNVAGITLAKTVTPASGYTGRAGDSLDYAFTIRNSGTSLLNGVTLTDTMAGLQGLQIDWSTSSDPATGNGSLSPNETVIGRASYTLTQADVNAGSVGNPNAVAAGLDPDGDRIQAQASASQTIASAPAISLTKSGALVPGSVGRAGDGVDYVFRATNTGNVTLTGVTLSDPLPGLSSLAYQWPGAAGVLQPGQTVVATARGTLTQAQVDAGGVDNTATVTGTPPTGAAVQAQASTRVAVAPTPAIAIDKDGSVQGTGVAGDRIAYTFDVTNSGNVTLTQVAISDPGATGITPPAGFTGSIAPGQTVRFTGSHVITQAEIDSGSFSNTASVAGTAPSNAVVRASDTVVTPFASTPGIAIDKVGSYQPGGPGNADDTIAYTFTIANTGRSTLSDVTLSDPRLGSAPVTYQWPGTPGTLLPGQQMVATATLPIAQSDIDAGRVQNIATAAGTGPGGATVQAQDAETTVIVATPGISLDKSTTQPSEPPQAGASVPYTFTIVNTGNVTLSGVALDDPMFEQSDLSYAWPDVAGVLVPGATVVVTAAHGLTQAEIDAGTLTNAATVSATSPGGASVSAADAATIAIPQRIALSTTKSVTLEDGALGQVGDEAAYEVVVVNSGTTTIEGVRVDDPMPGLGTLTPTSWPGAEGVLLPGEEVRFTATYTLTQADLDAQGVANTATASGDAPGDTAVSSVASAFLPLTPEPAISLTKDVTVPDGAAAGDAITYAFRVENVGTATLLDVRVDDPMLASGVALGPWPDAAAPGRLAPGEGVDGSAQYVLTQADVDAGTVQNTATVSATSAQGVAASDDDSATATLDQPQSLSIDKIATARGTGDAGSLVDYRFVVVNTGATTLSDVVVVDELVGLGDLTYAWPGAPGVLAPGQQVVATATYVVTQADVDAGGVDNSATATGSGPAGAVSSEPDTASVAFEQSPALQLTKTADAPAPAVGSTITYSFVATNTGDVTLTDVEIVDPLEGVGPLTYDWSTAVAEGVLAPGQSVRATATLVVTQADVDAARVDNTATATGVAPDQTTVDAEASQQVTVPGQALIHVQKVGVAENGPASVAGDTVTYTFTVRNTGTLTVTGVEIAEDLAGVSEPVFDWAGSSDSATPEDTLSPNEVVVATATYTLTQADVNAGRVDNSATATAIGADGLTASDRTSYTVALEGTASIELDKGHVGTPQAVGDTIEYTFTIVNNGTVSLTGVTVTDPMPDLGPIAYDWAGSSDPSTPEGELSPGETLLARATLVVDQSDLDQGTLTNTATATGIAPDGERVANDSAVAVLVQAPQVVLDKTTVSVGSAPGETVEYGFAVTNTGNVTLTDPEILDDLDGVDATIVFDWDGSSNGTTPAGVLAPGETVVATGSYVLTVADLDAGRVVNAATVTAAPPEGAAVTASDAVQDTLVQSPAIALVKSTTAVDPAVGDEIAYDFLVTNTGTVTLSGVTIDDPMPGLSAIAVDWASSSDDATDEGVLSPGETATATATYTVTQDDVDRGGIDNTATANGVGAGGGTASATSSARVDIASTSGFTFTKDVDSITGAGLAGDVVTYAFTIANSGTTTLRDVAVTDPLPGLSAISFPWEGAPGTLAPGATIVGTATYVITQADVDAGGIDNVATASANAPSGPLETQDATASVQLVGTPLVSLTKSGAAANGPASVAGDAVTWTFEIRNAGSVTLTDPVVVDALEGISTPTIDWSTSSDPSTGDGVLAPGETVLASARSTLTQAQVDAGLVTNDATVSATAPAPGGGTVTVDDVDAATVPLSGTPLLTLDKTHDVPAEPYAVGDEVVYRFTVTNAGTVTIDGVELVDDLEGLEGLTLDWAASSDDATDEGVLSPGETVTGSATLVVTQALVDAGSIDNVATVSGTAPDDAPVSDDDADTVLVPQRPGILLTKTATLSTPDASGSVSYELRLENTGTVTLTGVDLRDEMPGLEALAIDWAGSSDADTPEGTLAPGEVVIATATYDLTQADVDRGLVQNAAVVDAADPGGAIVEDSATVVTPIAQSPSISLDKSTSAIDPDAGDVVTYDFVVTNTGTVTLSAVQIADELDGISDVAIAWASSSDASTGDGTLSPGEAVPATATYVVTQADVDRGSLANRATVSGTPPNGAVVSASDDAVVAFDTTPSLSLTKTTTSVDPRPGDIVTFEFVLVNDGDVTMTGVSIADPLLGADSLPIDWSTDSSDPATGDGTLSPGEQVTASATYVVTQADVDASGFENRAVATGSPTTGPTVSTEAVAVVDVVATSGISVEKTGVAEQGPQSVVGDAILYDFVVENVGETTLTAVHLSDPLPGISVPTFDWATSSDPATPEGTLSPSETVAATASYVLTQDDVDAGLVTNTVEVTANDPDGVVVDDEDTWPVALEGVGALVLDKRHVTQPQVVGDAVEYELSATNVGSVTLQDVVIDDPLIEALVYAWPDPSRPGVLAPGESVVATGSVTTTQADFDAGLVDNAATATADAPDGEAIAPASDDDRVILPSLPSIAIEKNGTVQGANAGGTIEFDLSVANTGNVTLDDVAIVDELDGLGPVTIDWASSTDAATGDGVLSPGESVTATASYPLTQDDVQRGYVDNVATVDATSPTGGSARDETSVRVRIPGAPALSLEKSTDAIDPSVGDTITYDFAVENTGNVRLTGVTIVDPMTGLSPIEVAWPNQDAPGVLEVGDRATATATYVVTAADADAGAIDNTATATGSGRDGTATATDSATVVLVPAPALTLAKSGGLVAGGVVGDEVSYAFVVTNAGDVTLADVAIADALPGLSDVVVDWSGSSDAATGDGVLSAGETVTASASYVLTQADVDAGSVRNVATVVGTGPTGEVSAEDEATVETTGAPIIGLEKSGVLRDGSVAGDAVDYAFTIENLGSVTLSDVALTDELAGLSTPVIDWASSSDPSTGEGVLSPGETVPATAEYVLTQADVDSGAVENAATASGLAPDGETEVTATDAVVVALDGTAALSLEKSYEGDPARAGDEIAYTFVVTNSGFVTMTDVTVVDELDGLSTIVYDWDGSTDPATGEGVLSPGESVTATATYVVTQADVDAGRIVNAATATGTGGGDDVVVSPEDGVVAPLPQTPAISLEKSGTAQGSTAGDEVAFAFTVVNEGTVTLEDVEIGDELAGLSAIAYDWAASTDPSTGEGVLAPGESVTATATYALTQADVDAGVVTNAATVEGSTPGCDSDDASAPCAVVGDDDTVDVTLQPTAALTIEKSVDRELAAEGTTVTYAFVVANVGETTLGDVTIVDELAGLSDVSYAWPGEPGVLAPGEEMTATATYTVTEADARAGGVRNVAVATATSPGAAPVPPASDAVDLDVVPPGTPLPPTGIEPAGWLVVVALLLALAGIALQRRRRGRRERIVV